MSNCPSVTCGGWKTPENSRVLLNDINIRVSTVEPVQCSGSVYTAKGELDRYSCDCSKQDGIFITTYQGGSFESTLTSSGNELQIKIESQIVSEADV